MSSNNDRRRVFLLNLMHNSMGRHVDSNVMDPGAKYTREDILAACGVHSYTVPPAWVVNDASRRVGRGQYVIPEVAVIHALLYPHLYDGTVTAIDAKNNQ